MPIRVVDLEWTAPLPTYTGLGKGSVLALVRVNNLPAGLARVDAINGIVHAERLKKAIIRQVEISMGGNQPASIPDLAEPISIVVCTRERPGLLKSCLEALKPLAKEGHEIIIVDNAPLGTATRDLVKNYAYHYLVEARPGLNQARNRGLEEASHSLIAYTDDDCLPDPGWARAMSGAHASDQVGAVTGLVLPIELGTSAQERFESYCANRRIFRSRSFVRPDTPPSTAGAVGMGANMCFRKEILEKAGGFDPRFDGGTPTLSAGDTEIFARLLDTGEKLMYLPTALVWHRHPREEAVLRKVIFGYGAGLYAFLTKRLVEDRDLSVLWTAPRWLAGPPVKALWNRLRGFPATPFDLLWMEFAGSLSGPRRFLSVHRGSHMRDKSTSGPQTASKKRRS
jgi:GT2 family glycosyltransferase